MTANPPILEQERAAYWGEETREAEAAFSAACEALDKAPSDRFGWSSCKARVGPRVRPDRETERGSAAGSYLRLIDFVYHSTLGLRVIKRRTRPSTPLPPTGSAGPPVQEPPLSTLQ